VDASPLVVILAAGCAAWLILLVCAQALWLVVTAAAGVL